MKVWRVLRMIEEIEDVSKLNYECWVAYDSVDYIIEDIIGIDISYDWIKFKPNTRLDYRDRLNLRQIVGFLKQFRNKEIVATDSKYELTKIVLKDETIYFLFKDRFERGIERKI